MKHIIILIALILLSSGCNEKDSQNSAAQSNKEESIQAKATLSFEEKLSRKEENKPQLIGNLTDYNRNIIPITKFDGKPKLIGFWSSKCGEGKEYRLFKNNSPGLNCITSRAELIKIAKSNPDVNVIMISLDKDLKDAKNFLTKNKIGPTSYDFWIGNETENPLYWYSLSKVISPKNNNRTDTVSLIKYLIISKDGYIIDNDLPNPSNNKNRFYQGLTRNYIIDPSN